MLDALQERFDGILRSLKGQAKISGSNIDEAVREIRRALLEADVSVQVARDFVARVSEEAKGAEVLKGVLPGQQFVKIVHDQLTALLGGEHQPIAFAKDGPTIIMMVGLQGSGKTTSAAKLAHLLKRRMGRRPFLVAADIYRPAAVEQLAVLGRELDVPVFRPVDNDALRTAHEGLAEARRGRFDTVILDTAGRLHIDDGMMQELERIRAELNPHEILFVADAMIGQDAVRAARDFHQRLAFHGVVLTKLDGDTRGGAAMSIRAVTGAPVKFTGVGEKLDALEPFHPERLAQRILGMGDVVGLVEKVQEQVERQDAERMAARMARAEFDLEDFLSQLQMIKRLGPLEGLLKMIPGVGSKLKDMDLDAGQLTRTEAIIQSMTLRERQQPAIINGSRKARIARGSGVKENDVGLLLHQYEQMKGMMKQMGGMGIFGGMSPRRGAAEARSQPQVNPVSAGFAARRAQKKTGKKKR
ncbi:MAG: signal recognition particle protein [bacterium]|nr:signal recognition particle protein [bacterium]